MSRWGAVFHTFMTYSNGLLEDADETMVAGPVETLQTHIMACLALYGEKYDEQFEEQLPLFVEDSVSAPVPKFCCTRHAAHSCAPTVEAAFSSQLWISRKHS